MLTDRKPSPPSVYTAALFGLAVAYTLYFAASLLKPITLAVFFALVLSPAKRLLVRLGLPQLLAAGVLVISVAGVVTSLISFLAVPAEEWLSEAPRTLRELQREIRSPTGRMGDIQELAAEVDELTEMDNGAGSGREVVVDKPGIIARVAGGLPTALAFSITIVFLTFFLLAYGERLQRQAVRFGSTMQSKRIFLRTTRQVQQEVSRYLGIVTVINILLGCTTALILYLLQVSNPILWGVMVGAFNFAPYLGAAVSLVILTIVGITEFDSLVDALMVPGAFFVLTTLEGQLITPSILGRRMSMSPVIVFLSMLTWGWLWGVIGALIAVPILCTIVVLFDNLPGGALVADFLRGGRSGRRSGTRRSRGADRPAAAAPSIVVPGLPGADVSGPRGRSAGPPPGQPREAGPRG